MLRESQTQLNLRYYQVNVAIAQTKNRCRIRITNTNEQPLKFSAALACVGLSKEKRNSAINIRG